jgi:hypothetical protein
MTFRLALAVTFCAALHYAAPAAALTSVPIASGLADRLFLTSPVGDTRLSVAEKAGVIKVVQGGIASPWLDFYGDFVSGKIFSGRLAGGSFVDVVDRTAELGSLCGGFELTSFGEDDFGALYVMGRDGNLFRIAAAVPEPSTGGDALRRAGRPGDRRAPARQINRFRILAETRSKRRRVSRKRPARACKNAASVPDCG